MNRANPPRNVLVVGSGSCARMTANLMARARLNPILAADTNREVDLPPALDAGVEMLPGARLIACRGFAGAFDITLEVGNRQVERRIAGIVVAEETRREAAFGDYGLKPGPGVTSLSDFLQQLADGITFEDRTIVFLNGLVRENTPPVFQEVVRAALNAQPSPNTRCYVLTGNLKVAGQGLEALYREAKAAGVIFFKFEDTPPDIHPKNGAVDIEFTDGPSGQTLNIRPDMLVVDDYLQPAASLSALAGILDVQTDAAGFLQVENVHRFPVFTTRRGILAAGPARGPLLPSEMAADAAAAAAALLAPLEPDVRYRAEIDPSLCIRCLTCFRLCPYRAVRIGDGTRVRVEVAAEACEGCGICAAECPREAIAMQPVRHTAEPVDRLLESAGKPDALLALCCSRSSARAAELANSLGYALPEALRVVEVPCTGMISLQHLLTAVSSGARNVMVLACHEDNCHSETGNQRARMRVEQLRQQLASMGIGPERLQFHTLAANMAREFTDLTQATQTDT